MRPDGPTRRLLALGARMAAPVLAILLSACGMQAGGGGESNPAEPDRVGLGLSMLNYTDMPIGRVYVNGSWGSGAPAYNGCCGFAGGVSLPYPWQPETKVEVEWSDDELYAQDPQALYTAEVDVPPFEELYGGYLWVAFFPGKDVRVFVSDVIPTHPEFPEGLKVPRAYCQEQPGCLDWLKSGEPPREGHY